MHGSRTSSTAYCYDNAYRLTVATVTNPEAGANPVAGSILTVATPNATLAYDGQGNTTRLADQALEFDTVTRRRPWSSTIQRDATCRVITRTACALL